MSPGISKQILELVSYFTRQGEVLATTIDAIQSRPAFYELVGELLVAYAAIIETEHYQKVSSVVVHPEYQGNGLGARVVTQAIDYATKHSVKPVVAITNRNSRMLFLKLGFREMPKESAPVELWGGRTQEEWLSCDRFWLQLPVD